jgi:hypothetical protein
VSWLGTTTLIDVPHWGNATLMEVLWLISGAVAAYFTLLNVVDSWKDQRLLVAIRADRSVHDRHYRMIELSAQGRLSSQLSRMAIALLIVATGLVGIATPNPVHGKTSLTGLTVTVALVAISALTATRSFLDLRQRNQLYRLAMGRSEVLARRMRDTAGL